VHTAVSRRGGWRSRLPILSALTLLLSLCGLAVATTAAQASVTVSTFAGTGTAGFSGDGGAATSAQISNPTAITTDGIGNVYFVDYANKRIRKVGSGGNISSLNTPGTTCGTGSPYVTDSFGNDTNDSCDYLGALVTDAAGKMYFNYGNWVDAKEPVDGGYGGKEHVAGKVTGNWLPNATGGAYSVSVGLGATTTAVSANGGLFYATAHAIKYWNGSSDNASGNITNIAGKDASCGGYAGGGDAAIGACLWPHDLALSGHYLYFFDTQGANSGTKIFRIDLNESPTRHLTKMAGRDFSSDCCLNGLATNAGMAGPGPIAVSSTGEVYFGTANGGNGWIRKIDSSGYMRDVTTLASGEGDMTFDSADNLYATLPTSNKVMKITGLGSAGIGTGKNLVALGDSIAAGEGIYYGFMWNGNGWTQTGPNNPDWSDTTTAFGGNDYEPCHQSDYAYSRYLSARGYTVNNMGCTGASASSGILNSYSLTDPDDSGTASVMELGGDCTGCTLPPTGPAFEAHQPDVVTLTVGADDVHFGDWVAQCYIGTNACGTSGDTSTLEGQISTAQGNLRLVLTELNRRAGLMGKSSTNPLRVLVTNYYDPFSASHTSCPDISWNLSIGIVTSEMTWIENELGNLNGAINSEVNYGKSNDSNLSVDLVDLTSVMAGHEFCTSDPWVYGTSIRYPSGNQLGNNNPAPFHPTPSGQYAIYQKILAKLSS